jgi:hypothetical protein
MRDKLLVEFLSHVPRDEREMVGVIAIFGYKRSFLMGDLSR